ncbi:MAG: HD domain-containing protein, partial [Candidatus Moraniibacteriota bacterium]
MNTQLITIEDILSAAPKPFSAEERKRIGEAIAFATKAHEGQVRRSGVPYVTHTIATAKILSGIGMDASTVIAGLIHDVPEDTPIPLSEIEERFGSTVSHIVDGITKLGKIKLRGSREEYFLENLRKMFLAMAEDIRVVIVKLADRLHNMQTLDALPKDKQIRIAQETMD